jgi:hypothetical protein
MGWAFPCELQGRAGGEISIERGGSYPAGPRSADQARRSNTEVVQGAWNALAALLQDVGVDHGGGHIVVPEQLLNGADVGAALQQVGGKGMTKTFGILPVPSRPTY